MSQALKDAYLLLQANSGIAVGDTVRITRKAANYEMGWDCIWVSGMTRCIGQEGKVDRITDKGIRVDVKDNGAPYYPFFVLELVKKGKPPFEPKILRLNAEHTAVVSDKEVVVGCQHFSFATIEGLALAVKSAQEYNKS